MEMRICAAAAGIVLLSSAAWAQDGLRSASLPERTLAAPLPTAVPDRFRAGPDTYTQHDGRRMYRDLGRRSRGEGGRPRQRRLPSGFGFFPWGYTWDGGADAVRADAVRSAEPATPSREDRRAVDPPERREWPLPKAPGPGAPKTLYVIPGCYAGDKPPRPDQLRPGCEASHVVEIPPAG